jgi:FolB domain-containing protein
MTGEITIKNCVVRSRIGITPEERAFPQDLILNIVLTVQIDKALTSDNIQDTTDYFRFYKMIMDFTSTSRVNLLETLANSLADICLTDSHCLEAHITIEKPHILQGAESAGFSLRKSKSKK